MFFVMSSKINNDTSSNTCLFYYYFFFKFAYPMFKKCFQIAFWFFLTFRGQMSCFSAVLELAWNLLIIRDAEEFSHSSFIATLTSLSDIFELWLIVPKIHCPTRKTSICYRRQLKSWTETSFYIHANLFLYGSRTSWCYNVVIMCPWELSPLRRFSSCHPKNKCFSLFFLLKREEFSYNEEYLQLPSWFLSKISYVSFLVFPISYFFE